MSEQFLSSFDGTALHFREEGPVGAPAVVLSHSLGAMLQIWDALSEVLAPRFRVVRWDSRGHGRSQTPIGAYSVATLGMDALAVMDQLGLQKAHFVGLSTGGMTGMWLAANAPERLDRLVLANTTAFIPAKDHWEGLMKTALQEGMAEIALKTITGWLGETFKRTQPAGVDALVRAMAAMSPLGYAGSVAILRDVDLRQSLANIKAETLVIAGVEEGARGAEAASFLKAAIPRARRFDVPAAGHLSPLENPPAFNAAVLEFLG
jgi:3-oxoadipate enol-lactonase